MTGIIRLVAEHIAHYRVRAALMILAVMLGFFVFAVLGALRYSLGSGTDSIAERRLIVGHEGGLMQTLPMAHYDKIAAMEGIGQISHATWMGTYYREQRNMMMTFAVDGETWLDSHPDMVVSPEARAEFLTNRRSILVAETLADKYGWEVGRPVPLKSVMFAPPEGEQAWPFELAGTFVTEDSGGGRNYIISHYDFFNANRTLFKDSVGTFVIMPDSSANVDALSTRIDSDFSQSGAPTSTASDRAFHSEFFEQFGDVMNMIKMVVGVTFASLILVVASGMALSMRQRRKDIGVLRVIGFSNASIYSLVLGQVAFVVFAGAAAGLAFGYIFNNIIVARMPEFLPSIGLPIPVLGEAMMIALLVTIVTAALPVWLALKVKPVEAFAAE